MQIIQGPERFSRRVDILLYGVQTKIGLDRQSSRWKERRHDTEFEVSPSCRDLDVRQRDFFMFPQILTGTGWAKSCIALPIPIYRWPYNNDYIWSLPVILA